MNAKAFKDDAQAGRFGRWLKAITGDADHLRWCAEAGIPVVKADVEGINSAGGFLVPQDFAPIIISLREPAGVFRTNARVVPMKSDTTSVPRRVSGITAAWAAESNTAAESQGGVDDVALTAKKLSAFVKASNELVEDAVGLANFVASEIAYAFAGKEDDAGFNGDGTSTYGGVQGLTQKLLGASLKSKIAAAATHNTFLTIDGTDLANLIAGVMAAALPGAKWYMSQIGFATTLCRLAGASGGLTWQVVNGKVVPYYLGFPVVVTPKLPVTPSAQTGAVMMLFGDMSMACTVGDRRGVTVDVSTQRYVDTDQTAYRGTERVDVVVNDIGDTSVVGPMAALIGTA